MESVIFRYPLEVTDEQTIQVPYNSRILSVDHKAGQLNLWAEIPEEGLKLKDGQEWKILIRGTGQPFKRKSSDKFIGTVVTGHMVWHVYLDNSVPWIREED